MEALIVNKKEIRVEEMTQLREFSRSVSETLLKDISGYLKTLTPLFSPKKVLGEYLSGVSNDKVIGAEKNFRAIEERYKQQMLDGFGFKAKLSSVVPSINGKLSLTNWRESVNVDGKELVIIYPTKWVMSYDGGFNIQNLVQMNMEGHDLDFEEVSEFVIKQQLLKRLFENAPELNKLLNGLGYSTEFVKVSTAKGYVSVLVVNSYVKSFRPQDDLVKLACQLSGGSEFEELIDKEAIESIENIFQNNFLSLIE